MILKKKEFFLLIFLIFLQSCSGGRIGNFLESSFNDLEKTRKNEDLQNNLLNKNDINLEKENKKFDDKKNKKIKKVEKPKNVPENKNDINLEKENKKFDDKKNKKIKKIKKVENPKSVPENKKDTNLEKEKKEINDIKNKKIKKSIRKKNMDLQSYKIIFILKDVDPKDPTEELSSILSNSEVNFEIEKIERILDSKNKSMNKN
ncbi:hypothetical protein [Prochlorococcus marinus]|uniref:hypothetical protein n=1 Tax=Prochlorococcus marinus TaxID=1219 RepID=UPI00094CC71C|nr:hypothetical protein [Prochlorococcus marinus]